MKNMRVAKKLQTSFFIVIALAIIVGIVGFTGMYFLNQAINDMYEYNVTPIQAMSDLRETFGQERIDLRDIFLSKNDPQKVQEFIKGFDALEQKSNELFAVYDTTVTPGTENDEAAYFNAKELYLNDYYQLKNKIFEMCDKGEYDGAYQYYLDNINIARDISAGFSDSGAYNGTIALESYKGTDILYYTLIAIMVIVLIVTVIVSLVLAVYISGLISRPLVALSGFMQKAGETGDIYLSSEAAEMVKTYAAIPDETGECLKSFSQFIYHLDTISKELVKVADGDLTSDIKLLSENDVMGKSLKTTISNLNDMFVDIHNASEQVSMGATQISDGAQALASGSTEQAATVEELSASISEISTKTSDSANMAKSASSLASTIMKSAESGSEQMQNMIAAVDEINQANQSISQVIKVIDDIAFQTNILALNAAVEAARAGEHGKGFAVVADEVRNLASKSAESAKNTAALIENSLEKAELGTKIAMETSESLKIIVEGINDTNKINSQIADSAEEQSSAIGQINSAVTQVTDVVQQNSATAQESAAASEELNGQANMLESLIARFKLKIV